jgi:hypothetical protein
MALPYPYERRLEDFLEVVSSRLEMKLESGYYRTKNVSFIIQEVSRAESDF